MLYTETPEIFNPKFEAVGCFVEYEGKIILLLRQDHKRQPNTYWIPGGGIEHWETSDQAIQREVFEETGLMLDDIKYFKKTYVKYPNYDYIYHIYHKKLEEKPKIIINPEEHKEYVWKTPKEALQENFIQDLDVCIRMFYNLL